MTKHAVPDDVRRFILTSVPSVPYLEALLLLRSQPGRAWSAPAVAGRLYISDTQARELLDAMQQAGMAAPGERDAFRFAPLSRELTHLVDELAATYSQNLLGVTELIHSRLDKRAHQFAGAFRWKKEGG